MELLSILLHLFLEVLHTCKWWLTLHLFVTFMIHLSVKAIHPSVCLSSGDIGPVKSIKSHTLRIAFFTSGCKDKPICQSLFVPPHNTDLYFDSTMLSSYSSFIVVFFKIIFSTSSFHPSPSAVQCVSLRYKMAYNFSHLAQ